MPTTILKKKNCFVASFFLTFIILSYQCQAQQKKVEIAEMKDTVNWYVTKIKDLEKEKNPEQTDLYQVRGRFMVLMILNMNSACGSLPPPSSKIEVLEEYWKCVFEKAPYGKKFSL